MALEPGVNSYVSLEKAEAYFSHRLHADAWTAASPSDKEKALMMATQRIDRLPLVRRKASKIQALAFPRFPGTEVPQKVKDAVCEEAIALLKGIPKRVELQAQGVQSFTIGNLSETYTGRTEKLLSPDARELMRPYVVRGVLIT